LQSLYELLEPQLRALSVNGLAGGSLHTRTVILAILLIIASVTASITIARFLPIDLWCLIIVSNCLLTGIHALSATVVSGIVTCESRSRTPWEQADDLLFICKTATCAADLILSMNVVSYGILTSIEGNSILTSGRRRISWFCKIFLLLRIRTSRD
uniref:TRC8_N domain-containing protein n=1 Tax=Gongylonema pulchrum TaxID=637853 RepID=A0A183EYT5_9BILA